MTQIQALTHCLVLAITAPTNEKAQMASDLAEQIAKGLTIKQVNQCKKNLMIRLNSLGFLKFNALLKTSKITKNC